jgi:hypothetical protein
MLHRMRAASALLLCAALAAGCSRPGTLVAETGHHRLTAADAKTGITVVLTTDVWEGDPPALDDELTIVHALVANDGDVPVLLAPGDLELRDSRGFHYDLLDSGAQFVRAEPDASGQYARAMEAGYDIGRDNDYALLPPMGDTGRLALPWGVLEPKTQMRGYLYFEPIVRTSNGVRLVWHFGSPEHVPLVDMRFDLWVARG